MRFEKPPMDRSYGHRFQGDKWLIFKTTTRYSRNTRRAMKGQIRYFAEEISGIRHL